MKPWKLVLGAGAACAACCAAPLLSAMVALGIGSGVVAGSAGALSAFTQSWLPLAAGGVAIVAGAALVAWKRKRPTKAPADCGCSKSCPS